MTDIDKRKISDDVSYRSLLEKYIRYVKFAEGTDFISSGEVWGNEVKFTKEEWRLLNEIASSTLNKGNINVGTPLTDEIMKEMGFEVSENCSPIYFSRDELYILKENRFKDGSHGQGKYFYVIKENPFPKLPIVKEFNTKEEVQSFWFELTGCRI